MNPLKEEDSARCVLQPTLWHTALTTNESVAYSHKQSSAAARASDGFWVILFSSDTQNLFQGALYFSDLGVPLYRA